MIDASIKRLTRPKFKNDYEQYFDEKQFNLGDEDSKDTAADSQGESLSSGLGGAQNGFEVVRDEAHLQELMSRCDISYDGIPSHAALNFNPSFGKISMGEQFRVLFTI